MDSGLPARDRGEDRARDENLGHEVAIKILPPDVTRDEERAERLRVRNAERVDGVG
jgi:hypothetical protein